MVLAALLGDLAAVDGQLHQAAGLRVLECNDHDVARFVAEVFGRML